MPEHDVDCPCTRPLGLDVPLGLLLCVMRFHYKVNGLTWYIEVYVWRMRVRTNRGYLEGLRAAGVARKRYRRLPIHMSFIPTCEGGTRMNVQVGEKPIETWVTQDRPAFFVAHGKEGVTITPAYAKCIRAKQPILRGTPLLMTAHDRAVLCLILACLRALPIEMREFVLSFLNMSDLLYVAN